MHNFDVWFSMFIHGGRKKKLLKTVLLKILCTVQYTDIVTAYTISTHRNGRTQTERIFEETNSFDAIERWKQWIPNKNNKWIISNTTGNNFFLCGSGFKRSCKGNEKSQCFYTILWMLFMYSSRSMGCRFGHLFFCWNINVSWLPLYQIVNFGNFQHFFLSWCFVDIFWCCFKLSLQIQTSSYVVHSIHSVLNGCACHSTAKRRKKLSLQWTRATL